MGLRKRGARTRYALVALLGCVASLILAPNALAAGTGRISGTVEAAGKGVANVNVEVLTPGREPVGFATTEASGKYEVTGLAAGSYRVEFVPSHGSIYASQFYSGKSSFPEATPVLVEEAKATTGINAELHEGGTISGTVTNTSKAGLEHIEVIVYRTEGKEFVGESTNTNGHGEYTVTGLLKGSYKVEFLPGHESVYALQFYSGKSSFSEATEVLVEEGKTHSGVDAELQEGGKISGRVTDVYTHKPLANVNVLAYKTSGGGEEVLEENYAKTNANGEYTIVGLGSGAYKVEFEAEGGPEPEYITQYYNNKSSFEGANLVTAVQGSTTPGIDAALAPKAPVNTAGPLASGTPAVGQRLTCSNGSWTGEPKPTFAYQWLRNGGAISGAAASSYVVQTADRKAGLACKVTATNKHGSASAVSNTLAVPSPPPPPPPPPKPAVTLLSFKILVSGRTARVPIACANATCTGTIELTEQIVVRRHRGRHTILRRRTVILGVGAYALTAGHSATIFVPLTRTGRNALARARHHRLFATARVSLTGGATKYVSILLSQKPRRHRRR